jgi:FKBP-type peptidyl-prolyl cis-trans isomerase
MSRSTGLTPILTLSLFAGLLALGACESPGGNASLDTGDQKASYGIGLQMGGQLAPAETHLDLDAFVAGIRDGMAGNDPAVSQEELQVALEDLNAAIQEEMVAEAAKVAAEGEAFLAENANKEGVMVTESGLQYEVLREGEGPMLTAGDRALLHYRGTLLDGTEFDGSYDGDPVEFDVAGMIPGFSEGMQLMQPGGHYRLFIPSDLAYGPNGTGGVIGPNATLIFEVEILEIVQ